MMSEGTFGRGISREGVDAAFEAEETGKSNMILRASLLREQGKSGEASDLFAGAAAAEERLRDRCLELGLVDKFYVHAFSAIGCWAQAGDFHHAITLCNSLLAHPDLAERLRRRVQQYADALRTRREVWYAELLREMSAVEG